MATSDNLIPGPNSKQAGIDQLVNHGSSPAASPASPLVTLALETERVTSAFSGRKCLELYELHCQHGSSLKTLVEYCLLKTDWYSSKCVLTWKPKVTKSNRLLFQLRPSTLPIDEIGSGSLLATPEALNQDGYQTMNGKVYPRLGAQVKMLKTPSASEAEGGVMEIRAGVDGKYKMRDEVGSATGLKLQPNFVEWMMGFPPNWTDLNSPSQRTEKKD